MTVTFDGGTPSGAGTTNIQIEADPCAQVLLIASSQLQDLTNVQWPIDGMLQYLNLGIKEIIRIRPEAYTQIVNAPLAAGARQSLPPGALFLVDVESTLDAGEKPLGAVTLINKDQMDRLVPGWYSFLGTDQIQYAMRDDRNPTVFYVFPPPPATTTQSAALVVSCLPSEITSLTLADNNTSTPFPLDNSYVSDIVDYVIYRCLDEATTIPGAQAKASKYLQKFQQGLGIAITTKQQSDAGGA